MEENSTQSSKADFTREIERQFFIHKNDIDQRLHWCQMEIVGLKTNQKRLVKEIS